MRTLSELAVTPVKGGSGPRVLKEAPRPGAAVTAAAAFTDTASVGVVAPPAVVLNGEAAAAFEAAITKYAKAEAALLGAEGATYAAAAAQSGELGAGPVPSGPDYVLAIDAATGTVTLARADIKHANGSVTPVGKASAPAASSSASSNNTAASALSGMDATAAGVPLAGRMTPAGASAAAAAAG